MAWAVASSDTDKWELFIDGSKEVAEQRASVCSYGGNRFFAATTQKCHACDEWIRPGRGIHVLVGSASVLVHETERCRRGARVAPFPVDPLSEDGPTTVWK